MKKEQKLIPQKYNELQENIKNNYMPTNWTICVKWINVQKYVILQG